MQGDIALAGFVLTAEEWEELDPLSKAHLMAEEWKVLDASARTQLMGTLMPRREPWIVAGLSTVLPVFPEGSEPNLRTADLVAQVDPEVDHDGAA